VVEQSAVVRVSLVYSCVYAGDTNLCRSCRVFEEGSGKATKEASRHGSRIRRRHMHRMWIQSMQACNGVPSSRSFEERLRSLGSRAHEIVGKDARRVGQMRFALRQLPCRSARWHYAAPSRKLRDEKEVNCLEALTRKTRVISSQAFGAIRLKVQRLSRTGVQLERVGSASRPQPFGERAMI